MKSIYKMHKDLNDIVHSKNDRSILELNSFLETNQEVLNDRDNHNKIFLDLDSLSENNIRHKPEYRLQIINYHVIKTLLEFNVINIYRSDWLRKVYIYIIDIYDEDLFYLISDHCDYIMKDGMSLFLELVDYICFSWCNMNEIINRNNRYYNYSIKLFNMFLYEDNIKNSYKKNLSFFEYDNNIDVIGWLSMSYYDQMFFVNKVTKNSCAELPLKKLEKAFYEISSKLINFDIIIGAKIVFVEKKMLRLSYILENFDNQTKEEFILQSLLNSKLEEIIDGSDSYDQENDLYNTNSFMDDCNCNIASEQSITILANFLGTYLVKNDIDLKVCMSSRNAIISCFANEYLDLARLIITIINKYYIPDMEINNSKALSIIELVTANKLSIIGISNEFNMAHIVEDEKFIFNDIYSLPSVASKISEFLSGEIFEYSYDYDDYGI